MDSNNTQLTIILICTLLQILRGRARSSAWTEQPHINEARTGLLSRGSRVRIPPGPPNMKKKFKESFSIKYMRVPP